MERRNKITALLLQQRIVAAATIVATLLLCSVPSMAQSEIDPMGDGGSLGGDSGQTENGVAQVVISSSVKDIVADSRTEYYTLSGQRILTPRCDEVYVIRWCENGLWRTRKVVADKNKPKDTIL